MCCPKTCLLFCIKEPAFSSSTFQARNNGLLLYSHTQKRNLESLGQQVLTLWQLCDWVGEKDEALKQPGKDGNSRGAFAYFLHKLKSCGSDVAPRLLASHNQSLMWSSSDQVKYYLMYLAMPFQNWGPGWIMEMFFFSPKGFDENLYLISHCLIPGQ